MFGYLNETKTSRMVGEFNIATTICDIMIMQYFAFQDPCSSQRACLKMRKLCKTVDGDYNEYTVDRSELSKYLIDSARVRNRTVTPGNMYIFVTAINSVSYKELIWSSGFIIGCEPIDNGWTFQYMCDWDREEEECCIWLFCKCVRRL